MFLFWERLKKQHFWVGGCLPKVMLFSFFFCAGTSIHALFVKSESRKCLPQTNFFLFFFFSLSYRGCSHQGCAGRSFFQRGGATMKIRGAGRRWKSAGRSGAGRGEKARKSTDLKIRQKCVNCYWRICITVWCFDQGKHYILWLLNGLSANQIITSCTKDQMKRFSFISPL